MPEYPPTQIVNAALAPSYLTFTPTTTASRIDGVSGTGRGTECVGLLIDIPTYDNTPALVDANVYIQDEAGNIGIEMEPGDPPRFVGCSNTGQVKVKRVATAGGAVAFIRVEIVRTLHS